jgi:hypothetical protein
VWKCRQLGFRCRSLDSLRSLGMTALVIPSVARDLHFLRSLRMKRAIVHVAAHAHAGDDVPHGVHHDVVARYTPLRSAWDGAA